MQEGGHELRANMTCQGSGNASIRSPSQHGLAVPVQDAPSLLELPEGCLVEVLRNLPAKDAVAAQAICRSFRQLALLRDVWEPRIVAEFGLRLSVRPPAFH